MKNLDFTQFSKPLQAFISRFHPVIFFSVVVTLLSLATYTLAGIVIGQSAPNAVMDDGITTSFDQDTIKRIQKLHTNDSSSILLPSDQRINPFAGKTGVTDTIDFCTSTARLTDPARTTRDCGAYTYLNGAH